MRIAIISDIHANWQAWSAVRADLRAQRADTVVCLGDVVGYGPRPQQVLNDVRQHCDNVLLGNHEAAAAGQLDLDIFNPEARRAAEWTAQQLDAESRQMLGQLPLALEDEDLLFVHAEPVAPEEWGYVENPADAATCFQASDKRIVFLGHTHVPEVFVRHPDGRITQSKATELALEPGARYLVNVGSVGEPRDGGALASYCLYDGDAQTLSFRKLAFDLAALRRELQAQPQLDLPWFLQEHAPEAVPERREHAVHVPKVATTPIRVRATNRMQIKVGRQQVLNAAPARAPGAPARTGAAAVRGRRHTWPAALFFACAASLFGAAALVYFLHAPEGGAHATPAAAAPPQPPAPAAAPQPAVAATPAPTPSAPAVITLTATQAELHGPAIRLEQHETLPKYVAFWNQASDTVSWKLNVGRAGRYDLSMVYALAPKAGAPGVAVLCGPAKLTYKIKNTGSWYVFQTVHLGQLELPAGPCTLTMKSTGHVNGGLMNLRELRLQPAGG